MFAWTLTVSKEFHSLISMARGVRSSSSMGPTKVVALDSSGSLQLCNLGPLHTVFAATVILFRIVIAIALLICGLKFLSYTIEIPELLLNAVALEFVLNVDELIFESLAPFRACSFVENLQPVILCQRYQWRGLDLQSCSMFI